MKPFDLEAAKRGEPFTSRHGEQLFFVGVARSGLIACQHVINRADSHLIFVHDPDDLYMRPCKVVRWANVYRYADGGRTWLGQLCATEAAADDARSRNGERNGRIWLGVTRVEWEE